MTPCLSLVVIAALCLVIYSRWNYLVASLQLLPLYTQWVLFSLSQFPQCPSNIYEKVLHLGCSTSDHFCLNMWHLHFIALYMYWYNPAFWLQHLQTFIRSFNSFWCYKLQSCHNHFKFIWILFSRGEIDFEKFSSSCITYWMHFEYIHLWEHLMP